MTWTSTKSPIVHQFPKDVHHQFNYRYTLASAFSCQARTDQFTFTCNSSLLLGAFSSSRISCEQRPGGTMSSRLQQNGFDERPRLNRRKRQNETATAPVFLSLHFPKQNVGSLSSFLWLSMNAMYQNVCPMGRMPDPHARDVVRVTRPNTPCHVVVHVADNESQSVFTL